MSRRRSARGSTKVEASGLLSARVVSVESTFAPVEASRLPGAQSGRTGSPRTPVLAAFRSLSRRVSVVARLLLISVAFMSPSLLQGDQNSDALPALFDELLEAEDASIAARIESRIWREWLDAPDDVSGELLSRLNNAMQARDAALALELADELVETAPDFAEAWNKRATLHYLNGDDDLSVADIGQTLALEPRHFGAISGLGLIFVRKGDPEAALEAFEKVLSISPASRNARRSAESMRRELGREI